ncbi:hypothetical protein FA13DRAFT_1757344 [Coprinellus micaceus]|uniref:DUF1275 domain protein n=1 Tax=Coprinellus micaceus TaxID=71717 RepID=A0A4Y7SM25_COPMI|nr:hypothetical protein FA13DRAFT_1757344 [Coprinellus micaceus]
MPSSISSLKKNAAEVISYSAVETGSSSSSMLNVPTSDGGSLCARVKRCLDSEIDSQGATTPLLGYLFMAGYIDAISFSAIFVWCGFQTGNFAQVSLAVARAIEGYYKTPHPTGLVNVLAELPKQDRASLCSLIAFLSGLAIFGRLGDRLGTHKKGWLVGGTLIQALLTLVSAITFYLLESKAPLALSFHFLNDFARGSGLYFVGIACLSASLGVQGIMARRLGSAFSTTIVLTAIFVELVADPTFFQVTRPVRSRDQKWLAVFALFLGVVVGRLILGQLGTACTIGVGVLFRVAIAGSFLVVPGTHVHLP